MKRFLALAALVLGLASCQTEPEGLNVNVGGEVDTTITVTIPETETRYGTESNSAKSVFDNGVLDADNVTMRYLMQIFDQNGRPSDTYYVDYSDGKTVNFDVRLVPNRDYTFVVWADVVVNGENDDDNHYNTKNAAGKVDLTNISLNGVWNPMDESRDAFTVSEVVTDYNGAKTIELKLKRPFAKLRVITTDMEALNDLQIAPAYATVEYSTPYRAAFNAYTSEASAAGNINKTHTYQIATYGDNEDDKSMVLFTDYFFAENGDAVSFVLNVYEDAARQNLIKSNNFSTDIAVNRNYLTTIQGNVLTDGNNVKVTVEDAFANAGDASDDAPYYKETISSAAEFYKALEDGGEYIVISDFLINYAYVPAAQRTAAIENAATTLINLNGMTITVDNDTTDAFVTLNGGSLHIAGEGTIEGTGKLIEGDVVVTGGADINSNVADAMTGIDALVYICENGGEFTFTDNLTATEVVWVKTTNPVVINGNNFNLTSSANRIVRIEKSNAVVTFNDVNFISSAVATYLSDARGVSVDPQLSNVALTLNNCSIDFTDKTANDWTYAVNVSGNGTGHKVTVNGGTYEGANVVNAHGAKNTIVVKNATLTSLYPDSDLYYGACIWVLQNMESSVYAEGNTFNGSNAIAFNLGSGTALEEKNNIDNTKFLDNGTYYVASAQRLQEAVDSTKSDIKIEFIGDLNGDVTIIQKQGVKITIDGADYKYNGSIKVHSNSNYYADAALTIKNVNFETSAASINVIEALEKGSERYSQNITVEDCTFTATGEAVNTSVAVQVKATRGVTVTGCTATNMHSLIQAQSCDTGDVKVINSTVNGKNGVAFKQVKSATVEGTTITALEYGIRFDGNIDNYGIVVKNNNVTAAQPFIVRKMTGKNNTITLEGANTLTTEAKYQVVITNGSDDEAYVKPTGTYTLTGADSFEVFPEESINGYCDRVITNVAGVRYVGDVFESGYMENALWFNNYLFGGDAAIVVEDKTYNAIVIENCSGEFKNDVLTIKNNNTSGIIMQNLDLTLAEGKKLIKSVNPYYQVFMANITINGEKMTQETIGQYLENVVWYQVVEEI